MTDEVTLLQRARERDPSALAEIYDSYAPRIYAYIYRRVGDEHRAEDLTATVFLSMLEALDREKFARDALQSWLYRIAHNTIIDDFRRRERRPTSSLTEDLAQPPETNPDHLIIERLEMARVRQAIDLLTEEQRSVILLRFGEGLTAPETAELLGKTEEAVRALQHRSLVNLRRLLSPPPP